MSVSVFVRVCRYLISSFIDKAGLWNLIVCGCYAFPLYRSLYWIQFSDLLPQERESHVAQNKDLVADAQTLLEEDLSEKKSVESACRLQNGGIY